MKYWSVEVKGLEGIDVDLGGRYLRIRQVAIGDVEGEMPETVVLNVMFEGDREKHPIETLNPRIRPQQQMEWAFDRNFKLSHTLPNGIVYFCGSITKRPFPHGFKTIGVSQRPRSINVPAIEWIVAEGPLTVDECTVAEGPTKVPTVQECLDEVIGFPDFEEDSTVYLQAMNFFEKEYTRQSFMGLKTQNNRMRYLRMLLEEKDL